MGGVDGPVCAWAPGVCKSWCRTNAVKWAPEVIDILDEVVDGSFSGFGIHVDMFNPMMLKTIISCASMDEHTADMHTETMEALGIDGIFGSGNVVGRIKDELEQGIDCHVRVIGLVKNITKNEDKWEEPPKHVVDMWEAWDWSKDIGNMGDWTIGSMTVYRDKNKHGNYYLTRGERPDIVSNQQPRMCSRDEAIDAIARTVGDDMSTLRMSHTKVFYKFGCKTHEWPYAKLRAFSSLLNVLAKNGLVTVRNISPFKAIWALPPMGPKTSCKTGNVHVSLYRPPPVGREISWGSSMSTSFTLNFDPKKEKSSVEIDVTTSW